MKVEYKSYYSHIRRDLLRVNDSLTFQTSKTIWAGFLWVQEVTRLSLDSCFRNYFIKSDQYYMDKNSDNLNYEIDIYLGKATRYILGAL